MASQASGDDPLHQDHLKHHHHEEVEYDEENFSDDLQYSTIYKCKKGESQIKFTYICLGKKNRRILIKS